MKIFLQNITKVLTVFIFLFISMGGTQLIFSESSPQTINQAHAQQEYNFLAPIPGFSDDGSIDVSSEDSFPNYIRTIFNVILGFAILAAIITIIGAGFEYMTATSVDKTSGAKEKIQNAIGGLVLALAAVVILQTINPNLIEINGVETVTTTGGSFSPVSGPEENTYLQGSENFGNNYCFFLSGDIEVLDVFSAGSSDDSYVCYPTLAQCQQVQQEFADNPSVDIEEGCTYWYEATATVEQDESKFSSGTEKNFNNQEVKVTRIDRDRETAIDECEADVNFATEQPFRGNTLEDPTDTLRNFCVDSTGALCSLVEGSECSITQEQPETRNEQNTSQIWQTRNCYAEAGWFYLDDTGAGEPFATGPYEDQESCSTAQIGSGSGIQCYEIEQSYIDTPPEGSCNQIFNDAERKLTFTYDGSRSPNGYGRDANKNSNPVDGAWCVEIDATGFNDGWVCWDEQQICQDYEAVTRTRGNGYGHIGNDYILNSCQNTSNPSGQEYRYTCADCNSNLSANSVCEVEDRQDCKNCSTLSSLGLFQNFRPGQPGRVCDLETTADGECLVNTELGTKLQQFSNSFSDPWVLTEAWPPTVLHSSSCHAQGTCVDIALRRNTNNTGAYPNSTTLIEQHAQRVQNFAEAAEAANLVPVYEVGNEQLASELSSRTNGVEVLYIRGLPPHFSIYNSTAGRGNNDICPAG